MHRTGKIVVKKGDDVEDLPRYSVLLEYFPQAGSVDAVKGLLKIQNVYIEILLALIALLQSVNMCSVVPLPGLNPACSFRSISSTASVMRIMTTLQNTLLGIESNVTPLQLLQSARFPFLVFG